MTEPEILGIILPGIVMVAAALASVLWDNLVRAVIAFAVSSISLALIFFALASPYAAALELVVGSGLVTVLFLVALVLSGGEEEKTRT